MPIYFPEEEEEESSRGYEHKNEVTTANRLQEEAPRVYIHMVIRSGHQRSVLLCSYFGKHSCGTELKRTSD